MKKISYWAKNHIWQTRLIIVIIYILLNVSGIIIGKLLNATGVIITELYFTACLIVTILLWIGYPERQSAKQRFSKSQLYVRRKLFDFSLGAVTFLMIVYLGNHWKNIVLNTETVQASKILRIPKDSAIANNFLIKNFISLLKNTDVSKLSQKEKINLIKHQIRTIKENKGTTKGEKTALIALSVLVALLLLYGLAALSCSISCGGSEALAILVALAGTFLIVFLLVRIIKRISKGPDPKKKENIIIEK